VGWLERKKKLCRGRAGIPVFFVEGLNMDDNVNNRGEFLF
jgi:hypothetical protein